MSHEAMLETIKAELDDADAATLQSVWKTLRQAKQNPAELPAAVGRQTSLRSRTSTASEKPLVFIGENPPFDPNRTFSFKERAAEKRRLKAQNREWLLQKFNDLKAGWLMVVDRQVIASGPTLSDYPNPEQLLAICHRTGKFPFLFINENINARHLGQIYEYLTRSIVIEIIFPSGEVRSLEVPIACVTDWQNSPFVAIKPSRIALLGRAVFLILKPRILLDFDKQESRIWAPLQLNKKTKLS